MKRNVFILSIIFLLSSCSVGGAITSITTRGGIALLEERSVGEIINDTAIWAEIKHHYLQKDFDNILAKVNVKVHEGRVLLTGGVIDEGTLITALELAWKPGGVREVINEVILHENLGLISYAKDSSVTAQAKAQLLLKEAAITISKNSQ